MSLMNGRQSLLDISRPAFVIRRGSDLVQHAVSLPRHATSEFTECRSQLQLEFGIHIQNVDGRATDSRQPDNVYPIPFEVIVPAILTRMKQ